MMFRLLKDLINWKCNLYIKCKLGKCHRYVTASSSLVFLSLFFLVSLDLAHCSSLSNIESGKGRTLYEHGIFRHDKPWASISQFPPRSDNSESNKNDDEPAHRYSSGGSSNMDNNVNKNSDYSSPTISPPDNRDKYTTYDRFKRSVTTLNFHPKPKNNSSTSSSASGLKPMRIFKYMTEDDVLQPHSETHHQTIFHPFMKNESEPSPSPDKSHSVRVVGGAKVNLKAKLDKDNNKSVKSNKGNDDSNPKKNNKSNQVIRSSNPNKEGNQSDYSARADSESKSAASSQPKLIIPPTPSKPENILIFKPSLAIRKNGNKTSLIPSGKYARLNTHLHHLQYQHQMSNGVGNSITAATSTNKQQQEAQQGQHHEEEESTDPNSATVNDRSLIHNYFDSVVVLNEEEGQKLVGRQGAYREKTSNSDDVVDNVVGSGDDEHLDDGGDVDDKIKNSISAAHPPPRPPTSDPSSFSFTSALTPPNSNPTTRKNKGSADEKGAIIEGKKISSPNLPITKNKSNDNTNGYLVEKIHNKMNKTIGDNRDKLIVKVVKKNKKNKPKQEGLVEDDGAQDGSERSRRSPFKLPPRFQQQQQQQQQQHPGNRFMQINMNANHNHNHGSGGHEQLARAAMFRRNTAIMMTPRIRQLNNHAMKQKVSVTPRIITTGSSGPYARTIIPMQPIPVMPLKKSGGPQKLKFMPSAGGPIGPGPVGPPLAAIKVMPLTQIQNVYAHPPSGMGMSPLQPLPLTQSKDLMADSSKTIFNFKPFPESNVLNLAASSYYSPTYRRFQNRFQDQISGIMESGKELEDETANAWDESRPPPRRHRHHQSRPRPRSSGRHRSHHRHHHPRHDHYHHRHHHSPHRSGAHSQHPQHHPPPSARGKKLNPKYKYPKNAESIQDILKYFDKDPSQSPGPRAHHHGPPERTGPTNPKRQHSSIPASENPPGPAYTKMADLSGEFRDVHASLLKDIKEFAKRPSMFSSSSDNYDRPSKHQNSHSHSHNRDSAEGSGFFDPIDEIFNPKPKPVRDMIKSNHNNYDIKPDLYSLENIRERIALKRGKLGGRHKEKEQTKDPNSFQFDPPPHSDDEDYDTHKPSSSRYNSDSGFSAENTRHYTSKEDYDAPVTYSKKNRHNKQDSSDDSANLYPSSHYKESHYKELPFEYSSAEYPPTKSHSHSTKHSRKPVVLKRPNEGYRARELEAKKKSDRDRDREHEYLWNPYAKPPTTVNLDSPLVLKSPQPPTVLQPMQPFSYASFQAAAAQAMAHAKPPISVSEEEDIVEIHTGSQGPSGMHQPYVSDSHHLKQERLKKMYMDVLQQKMQLEAALLQPQALPQLHHPQMSAIQSMHSSGSYLPQHNPLQLSRVSLAPPMSSYSPQTIVTHPPMLTGLSGMTTSRRKKPMRMKIHIYPNGNGNEGIEQGLEAANLLAGGGFGASGFSASNPPPSVVAPPNSQDHKMSASAIPSGPTGPHSTSPSGYGGTAHGHNGQPQHQHQHHHPMPQTVGSAVKNKNVVLHLHVHRRNDQGSSGQVELETEGSNPIAATVMPPKLTYKDIYDEQLKSEHQDHLQNHRMAEEEEEEEEERSLLNNSSPQEGQESQQQNHNNQHDQDEQDEEEDVERDKSISMEAPIHDEKIEDVFHTIMKLRKRPASSSAGATAADKRKKRNRN